MSASGEYLEIRPHSVVEVKNSNLILVLSIPVVLRVWLVPSQQQQRMQHHCAGLTVDHADGA